MSTLPRESGGTGGALAWLAAGSLLAAGLSAYLLLPLGAEAGLLSRGAANYDFFLAGHAIEARHLATFLLPEALGNPLGGSYAELWEDVAYFGIFPLIAAAIGVALGHRRTAVRGLAAAFAACVLFAADTPLLRLLFEIVPGFALFRCPSRWLFLASICGIALSGFGVQELLREKSRLRRAAVAAMMLLMVAEGLFYARRYLTTAPTPRSSRRPDTRGCSPRASSPSACCRSAARR